MSIHTIEEIAASKVGQEGAAGAGGTLTSTSICINI